jgi:hypothetical protein
MQVRNPLLFKGIGPLVAVAVASADDGFAGFLLLAQTTRPPVDFPMNGVDAIDRVCGRVG